MVTCMPTTWPRRSLWCSTCLSASALPPTLWVPACCWWWRMRRRQAHTGVWALCEYALAGNTCLSFLAHCGQGLHVIKVLAAWHVALCETPSGRSSCSWYAQQNHCWAPNIKLSHPCGCLFWLHPAVLSCDVLCWLCCRESLMVLDEYSSTHDIPQVRHAAGWGIHGLHPWQ